MAKEKEPPSIVRGVMTEPVITVSKDHSVLETVEIMSKKSIGCVVIMDKGKPVGIATERDILKRVVAEGLNPSEVKIEEIMSKPVRTINGDMAVIEAIRVMQKNDIRHLPVIEKEELVGIVTQRDLLRALAFHVIISFRPLLQ
ncbi:MAG: CBS domain-containing protein [Candidatus Bathyarchaeota archaeon]|jgi:CBS domain-containing protein